MGTQRVEKLVDLGWSSVDRTDTELEMRRAERMASSEDDLLVDRLVTRLVECLDCWDATKAVGRVVLMAVKLAALTVASMVVERAAM